MKTKEKDDKSKRRPIVSCTFDYFFHYKKTSSNEQVIIRFGNLGLNYILALQTNVNICYILSLGTTFYEQFSYVL